MFGAFFILQQIHLKFVPLMKNLVGWRLLSGLKVIIISIEALALIIQFISR
jgi:hypothetical protein